MTVRFQLKRDTAANWELVNPVLLSGEIGIETDTSKFKFGNGTSNWLNLDYAKADVSAIPTKLSDLTNDCNFITLNDV